VTKVARNVAQVTLLTDDSSAASAIDIRSNATGIVRHGSSGTSLILDRVTKDQVVNRGDVISTSGWKVGSLSSIYPRGIPIGVVTSVGQVDTDLYKQIQIEPFPDYGSLETVLVLMPKQRGR
jgi:rod shape-determining protein MreC